jgi:WD40 repeat protein
VLTWDPRKRELAATLDGHDEAITHLLYDSTGEFLFSGSGDGLITIWHPESGQAISQLSGFESGVIGMTIARGGDMLVAHYEGGHCLAWDLTRWQR